MIYKPQILGKNGLIYNTNNFLSCNKNYFDAIGIIFGSDIIGKRILAFESWESEWGNQYLAINTQQSSEIVQTLCGLENTRKLAELGDYNSKTAANICWNYRKGDFQWYLPSIIELATLYFVRDEINEMMLSLNCLDKCFLPKQLDEDTIIHTSSEYNKSICWGINFNNGSFNIYNKSSIFHIRAIANYSDNKSSSELNKEEIISKLQDYELIHILRQHNYTGILNKKIII